MNASSSTQGPYDEEEYKEDESSINANENNDKADEREHQSLSICEQSLDVLQLSNPSHCLPCRESETKQIYDFLYRNLRQGGGQGGSLYISGVPGTGYVHTYIRIHYV